MSSEKRGSESMKRVEQQEIEASEKCIRKNCVYVVDWANHPETTGYSMWKGDEAAIKAGIKLPNPCGRYGCMRYLAMINQKELVKSSVDIALEAKEGFPILIAGSDKPLRHLAQAYVFFPCLSRRLSSVDIMYVRIIQYPFLPKKRNVSRGIEPGESLVELTTNDKGFLIAILF